MKKITQTYALFLFILLLAASIGCSDEENMMPEDTLIQAENKLSFRINGGNYNNRFMEVRDFSMLGTKAGYVDSLDATLLQAIGQVNNKTVSLSILHPGQFPTLPVIYEYYDATDGLFDPTLQQDISLFLEENTNQLLIRGATLQIDSYGEQVGDLIKGNFFGTFDDLATGSIIQINNGTFELIRTF